MSRRFFFFLIFIILFFFDNVNSEKLIFKSVILVEHNIPARCGLEITKEKYFLSKLVIEKNGINKKIINFYVKSENFIIEKGNIKSQTVDFKNEVFNEKIKKEEGVFSIKGNLDENMTNQLFQELFISGGLLEINNENFIIEGPIDSKVRLEYLFCVGEMFHPKYEK